MIVLLFPLMGIIIFLITYANRNDSNFVNAVCTFLTFCCVSIFLCILGNIFLCILGNEATSYKLLQIENIQLKQKLTTEQIAKIEPICKTNVKCWQNFEKYLQTTQ